MLLVGGGGGGGGVLSACFVAFVFWCVFASNVFFLSFFFSIFPGRVRGGGGGGGGLYRSIVLCQLSSCFYAGVGYNFQLR